LLLPPAAPVGATPPLQHEAHDPPRELGLHALALLVAEARAVSRLKIGLGFEPSPLKLQDQCDAAMGFAALNPSYACCGVSRPVGFP